MASSSSSSPSSSAFAARSHHHLVCPRTRSLPAATVAAPRRRPRAARVVAASPAGKSRLAGVWRKIQGADDWSGLVEPLDPLLREEVVRYGELVAACYKAFDLEPSSKRYLNCKYGKSSMLREVGLAGAGYVITKYIYATPDIGLPAAGGRGGRWIGYVAVADDEEARRLGRRDVVVSFRGTVTGAEWVANLMSSLTPANLDPLGGGGAEDVRVESGFLSLYTSDDSSCRFSHGSCREQLLGEVARLVAEHGEDEEISITVAGHSMGAALALLLGYDVAELGLHRPRRRYRWRRGEPLPIPVTVYSFGGPRVGNAGFKRRCEELGVKVLRVVNVHDPVTKLPGVFLNERWGGRWGGGACYAHVGVELALEFFKAQNPASVHDLDAYIGLLRCPKVSRVHRDGVDLVGRARKMLRMQSLQGWPWQDVARHVGDLVQSLSLI